MKQLRYYTEMTYFKVCYSAMLLIAKVM